MEMSLSRLVKSIYGTCLLHFHKNAFANFINVQGRCQKGGRRERQGGGGKLIAKHCEICETEFTCTGDSLALLQLISKVSASCTGRRFTPPPLTLPFPFPLLFTLSVAPLRLSVYRSVWLLLLLLRVR